MPYWRFTRQVEKLSIDYGHSNWTERSWSVSDMERWLDYDDELSGLEDYCKEEARLNAEWRGDVTVSERHLQDELHAVTCTERYSAVAFKILWPACQGRLLRSLAFEPSWALGTPALVSSCTSICMKCLDRADVRSRLAGRQLDPDRRVPPPSWRPRREQRQCREGL